MQESETEISAECKAILLGLIAASLVLPLLLNWPSPNSRVTSRHFGKGFQLLLVGLPRSADHRDVRNDGKSRKDYWTLTPDDHVLGKEPGDRSGG